MENDSEDYYGWLEAKRIIILFKNFYLEDNKAENLNRRFSFTENRMIGIQDIELFMLFR